MKKTIMVNSKSGGELVLTTNKLRNISKGKARNWFDVSYIKKENDIWLQNYNFGNIYIKNYNSRIINFKGDGCICAMDD